ncbi:MAG TPA: hypothetical protein VMW93_06320 [bacterium]|nr:hypothetical protein [bacterium]
MILSAGQKAVSKSSLLVTALFVAAAAGMLAVLPPDGFFSSDEGVKFIQLRSLAESGFRDARIVWPGDELGLERRYAVVERFFELRGGELYSPHPLLFALASAPGWLLFGYRGLYLLPLLAGAAAVASTTALARGFGVRRPWLAGAVVAFASPIFFYSLCYWEHAPAVALWLGGFALLRRRSTARLLAAGALWGAGAALRPEFYGLAAWSVAALLVFHKGERLRTAAWPAAACAVTAVGLEFLMQAAWGQPAFMRFGANLGYGAAWGPAAFLYAVGHSLVPLVPWYLAAGAAAVVAFAVAGLRWRPGAYVAAAGAVPLVVLYWGFFGGYATALAASFPAAFGLVFLARPEGRRPFRGLGGLEKSFYVASLGFAATLFVVLPDTSGFAWGPRFLLYVLPPAALALSRLASSAEEGAWRRVRTGAIIALAAISAATQVFGLARLRGEKESRLEIVRALEALEAAPVIVNCWYLPMYAAPLYAGRPFIVPAVEESVARLAGELRDAGAGKAFFLAEGRAAEGEEFTVAMTSLLAVDFDVGDVRAVAECGRGDVALRYYLWSLRVPPPRE